MIDVQQRRLSAFNQHSVAVTNGSIQKMSCVGDEWPKTLRQHRHLIEDGIGTERLAAVSDDDAICVFEVSLDAITKYVRYERVGSTNSAAPGFVFVCRANASQRRTDFFVAETFFTRVVQRAMIREDLMRA